MLRYFHVPQSPPYTTSPCWRDVVAGGFGMAFWLFAAYFLNCSSIKFLEFFPLDSSKFWIRNISEDFPTVLNKMFFFKQSSTTCLFPKFWYGFFHSLLIFFFKCPPCALWIAWTLNCPCHLFSLFTIFCTILEWWNFLPSNFCSVRWQS